MTKVGDVARQLQPALGGYAVWLLGIGLFAAGLTSAITAPVAAAYAAAGCFGWPNNLSDRRLKCVAIFVLMIGLGFAIALGGSPAEAILLAQVANGLLLPVVAIFLLVILNRVELMHRFRNKVSDNILGGFVVIVVTLIAIRQFKLAYEKLLNLLNEATAAMLIF